jgi:hypothetical protein
MTLLSKNLFIQCSKSDLDLWSNDPNIYRILPLPQGNHMVKFGKDPIYRTHMILLWKGDNPIYFGVKGQGHCYYKYKFWQQGCFRMITLVLYIVDLWSNDPNIYRILPLPQGNHMVKFGKDPIYRTKVIMWKRPRAITLVLYIGSLPNVATWFSCGRGITLFILGSKVKVTVTINIIFYRLIIYKKKQ